MLNVERISTYYGNFEAIREVSISIKERERVTLIGANGAGKTTLLRTISGLNKPTKGKVLFEGRDITPLRTVDRLKKGISYCPEGRKLFPEMTVLENLELGAYIHDKSEEKDLERIFALFPILQKRRFQYAGTLSGGEQQMVTIGRSLMARPKLILFDEPTVGLAPLVIKEMQRAIENLGKEGLTIFLVEQNVYFAFAIAQKGYIMENGRIVMEGEVSSLMDNSGVKEAYLGM